jgi:aminopeptidase N
MVYYRFYTLILKHNPPVLLFAFLLTLVFSGCGKRQNPTPQLASGKAFVIPSDSVIEVFKSRPVPAWAAKKFTYKPEATRYWDLIHTRLDVSFDWVRREMKGQATLLLKPYFYSQKNLVLDAKMLNIESVVCKKSGKTLSSSFKADSTRLTINLDTQFSKDQELEVEIQYSVRPEDKPKGGSLAISQSRGLYFINPDGSESGKPRQIWTQGEPQSASAWFPTIDSPSERCTQEMHITVENQFKTLSNGVLLYSKESGKGLRTDVWEMKQPHSPYLFMMAIGEYAVVKDSWRKVPLQYWVEPKYQPLAKAIFGKTPRMMEYFSNRLGVAFPWPKYDQVVVRDFVSGAMENTSASVFMEALQCSKKELVDRNWDDIIAHELFHQWFGDLVSPESWANLPLNESFANYSQYLWDEYANGVDEADFQAMKERQSYFFEANRKQEPLIRYYHNKADDMFDSHSYAKGGRILHMLRKWVGDEAFFEALRIYLSRNAYKSTEIHHLRLAFEEASGQDLNWFFNQWFLSAGHPSLSVRYTYQDGNLKLSVQQLQDTIYSPVYRLPTDLEVWAGGDCQVFSLNLTQLNQEFNFPLLQKPDAIIWDREHQFLGELDFPLDLNLTANQYRMASKGAHRLEALQRLKQDFPDYKESGKIFGLALYDSFWTNRLLGLEGIGARDSLFQYNHFLKIKEMAERDRVPQIRAQAVKFVSRFQFPEKSSFLEKSMKDSSLRVSTIAYKLYIKEGYPDIDSKIQALKSEDENLYSQVLADYYASKPTAGPALDWFKKTLRNPDLEDPYEMILTMGKWMERTQDTTSKSEAMEFLLELSLEKQKPEIVFGCYQVLKSFQASKGVKEKLLKIKEACKGNELEEILEYLD